MGITVMDEDFFRFQDGSGTPSACRGMEKTINPSKTPDVS